MSGRVVGAGKLLVGQGRSRVGGKEGWLKGGRGGEDVGLGRSLCRCECCVREPTECPTWVCGFIAPSKDAFALLKNAEDAKNESTHYYNFDTSRTDG